MMFVYFVLYMIEEPVENGCHEETVKAKNDQNKPNKEQTSCERPAEKDNKISFLEDIHEFTCLKAESVRMWQQKQEMQEWLRACSSSGGLQLTWT